MDSRKENLKKLKKLRRQVQPVVESNITAIIGNYSPYFLRDKISVDEIQTLSDLYASINPLKSKRLKNSVAGKDQFDSAIKEIASRINSYYLYTNEDNYNGLLNALYAWSFDTELLLVMANENKKGFETDSLLKKSIDELLLSNNDNHSFYQNLLSHSFEMCCLQPCCIVTSLLLKHINENYQKVFFIDEDAFIDSEPRRKTIVFGSSNQMKSFFKKSFCFAHMFYRSIQKNSESADCILLASYEDFASIMFGAASLEFFTERREVDFSILIPIKNYSPDCIKSTIDSCLAQKTWCSFEVLISINDSCTDEKSLSELIGIDNRVRIIKTPYCLSLARSFEYAYLRSRGKYIISIGSDDALMPNALDIIQSAFEKTNSDIVMWKMAYYYWPDFHSKKGASLTWDDNNTNRICTISMKPFCNQFGLGEFSYLDLPNLYLKTCIKYSQIWKIIHKTGKFEDGYCQDIYTGLVNSLIDDQITFVDSTLVVAGSSQNSTGKMASEMDDFNVIVRRARNKLINFRFSSYYPDEFDILALPYGLGNNAVSIREYVKILYYHFHDQYDALNRQDIFQKLFDLYCRIPFNNCSKSVIVKPIEQFLIKQGISHCRLFFFRAKKRIGLCFLSTRIINKLVLLSYDCRKRLFISKESGTRRNVFVTQLNRHLDFPSNDSIVEVLKYVSN